jgi:Ca-activated chloride channel family protein
MTARNAATIALVIALGVGAAAAQAPTFSARVEVVRLDVLVTDNGQPVRGLTVEDFDVFDNGVRQTLDLVSFEQIPLDVVLTLDASASVRGARLDHLREASRAVLGALKKDDKAALITFSEAVIHDAGLTSDVDALQLALDAVDPSGDTALTDGAYTGITVADGSGGRGLVIVFSDGVDTASWLNARAVVDAGRRSEVVVYGVSAAGGDPSFLRDLTSATGGRLYQVSSTRTLGAAFLAALQEFRQRYLVSYTPRGVSQGGWHKLEVKLKNRRGTVRARPGYLGDER